MRNTEIWYDGKAPSKAIALLLILAALIAILPSCSTVPEIKDQDFIESCAGDWKLSLSEGNVMNVDIVEGENGVIVTGYPVYTFANFHDEDVLYVEFDEASQEQAQVWWSRQLTGENCTQSEWHEDWTLVRQGQRMHLSLLITYKDGTTETREWNFQR